MERRNAAREHYDWAREGRGKFKKLEGTNKLETALSRTKNQRKEKTQRRKPDQKEPKHDCHIESA